MLDDSSFNMSATESPQENEKTSKARNKKGQQHNFQPLFMKIFLAVCNNKQLHCNRMIYQLSFGREKNPKNKKAYVFSLRLALPFSRTLPIQCFFLSYKSAQKSQINHVFIHIFAKYRDYGCVGVIVTASSYCCTYVYMNL